MTALPTTHSGTEALPGRLATALHRAACSLSTLTRRSVQIRLEDEMPCLAPAEAQGILQLQQPFGGAHSGWALLEISRAGARRLLDTVLGGPGPDDAFNSGEQAGLLELGSLILGEALQTVIGPSPAPCRPPALCSRDSTQFRSPSASCGQTLLWNHLTILVGSIEVSSTLRLEANCPPSDRERPLR